MHRFLRRRNQYQWNYLSGRRRMRTSEVGAAGGGGRAPGAPDPLRPPARIPFCRPAAGLSPPSGVPRSARWPFADPPAAKPPGGLRGTFATGRNAYLSATNSAGGSRPGTPARGSEGGVSPKGSLSPRGLGSLRASLGGSFRDLAAESRPSTSGGSEERLGSPPVFRSGSRPATVDSSSRGSRRALSPESRFSLENASRPGTGGSKGGGAVYRSWGRLRTGA